MSRARQHPVRNRCAVCDVGLCACWPPRRVCVYCEAPAMRHVVGLRLENWGRFRGVHELRLGPLAYAVTAEWEHDRDRSNYGGKSMLLESVPFALYGWLNPDRGYRQLADWITRGEAGGAVRVELDDGTVVERSLTRGRSTLFGVSREGRAWAKDEAAAEAERAVGFAREDFFAGPFVRQRDMARLVNAPPGELTKVFSAWLRLGPLEAAAGHVEDDLAALEGEVAPLRRRLEALAEAERAAEASVPPGALTGLEAEVARLASEVEVARWELARNARLIAGGRAVAQYREVVEEGRRVRAEIDARDESALRADLDAATARWEAESEAHREASRAHQGLRVVAAGEFDGACPVGGIQCPARDQINGARKENAGRASAAGARAAGLDLAVRAAAERLRGATAPWQELQRLKDRRGLLVDQLRRLHPAYARAAQEGEPRDHEELQRRASVLETAHAQAAERANAARGVLGRAAAAAREAGGIRAALAKAEGRLATLREAALVLGRQGAQRRAAEDALAGVEAGANDALADAGVGLSVRVRWAREGGDPARACARCGESFPRSARAKACARCGAERGKEMVNRVDLVLSDRSGAAEDLCGLAVQLSAAAWLRADRDAAWGAAFLDEPCGALDQAHRRAFGAGLPRMLAAAGYVQSFVTSHSAEVLHSLPGRILVRAGEQGSSAEVVA